MLTALTLDEADKEIAGTLSSERVCADASGLKTSANIPAPSKMPDLNPATLIRLNTWSTLNFVYRTSVPRFEGYGITESPSQREWRKRADSAA